MAVFNTDKLADDYVVSTPFLNKEPGLLDTVNKCFPKVWDIYKLMRSCDWTEDDFNYTDNIEDFVNGPQDVASIMLKTLMWQWESDSVASRAPTIIIAPFNPSTEIWTCEQRITDNESIHAATYSEIVRTGVPNSNEVIGQLLETTEVIRRLGLVSQTLDKVMAYSRKIAYEQKCDRFEAYEHLLLFYYAMLILERIQFIASFAITFSICDSGLFQSIGQAVKLICRDELQVHCEYRKEVLREILKTEEGKAAYQKLKPTMEAMLDEVIDNELSWTEWLFDGRSIVGTNASIVKKFVLYSARDVALFLDLNSKHRFVKENPMPHLIKWFDIDYSQSAPQENDVPNYKLGTVSNDDDGEEFDL